MIHFKNKITCTTRHLALALLTSLVLVACGGGGGGGNTTTPPAQSALIVLPMGTDVVFTPVQLNALVGLPGTYKVRIMAADERNAIISYSVTNPTPGGAVPTVDASGIVSFTPNDADINTFELKVTIVLREGGAKTVNVPVEVRKEYLLATITLQAAQTNYSDPRGGYLIEVGTHDGSPISGEMRLVEIRAANGSVRPYVELSNPQVWVRFLETPINQVPSPASGITTQGFNDVDVPEPPQVGLIRIENAAAIHNLGVIGMGSILGDDFNQSGGSNLVTTRYDLSYPVKNASTLNRLQYRQASQKQVIQIDATCATNIATIADCLVGNDKAPVILIHGFNPEYFGLGGGEGTWGTFASRLKQDNRHVFEFRWATHMRFEEAAGQFAKLVTNVGRLTNKKPVIIAHSFGGIVARLALGGEGIKWSPASKEWGKVSAPLAERLITLGTPHSGIHDNNGGATLTVGRNVDGSPIPRTFVYGRHWKDATINGCESITCIQAGALDVFDDSAASSGFDTRGSHYNIFLEWIKSADPSPYAYDNLEAKANRGELGHLFAGETIKKLDNISLPVTVIVGAIPSRMGGMEFSPVNEVGDRLISFNGQMISGKEVSYDSTLQVEIKQSTPYNMSTRTVGNITYHFLPNGKHTNSIAHWSPSGFVQTAEPYYAGANVTYCPGASLKEVGAIVKSIECATATLVTKSHHEAIIEKYLNSSGELIIAPPPASPYLALSGRFIDKSSGRALPGMPFRLSLIEKSSNLNLGSFSFTANPFDGSFEIDLGGEIPEANWTTFDPNAYFVRVQWGDNIYWNVSSKDVISLAMSGVTAVGDIPVDPNTPAAGAALSGKVIDGQTVATSVPGATIYLKRGIDLSQSVLLTIASSSATSRLVVADEAGNFSVSGLEPGEYSALIVKDGFTSATIGRLLLLAGANTQNLSILRILPPGEATITLRWLAGGVGVSSDLDSHLIRLNSAGTVDYHIYYAAQTVFGLLDSLDRDDTSYEGPETITLALTSGMNYAYYVHDFAGNVAGMGSTIPQSDPDVILRIGGTEYRYRIPGGTTNTAAYWRVFDIVNGRVVPCQTGCFQSAQPSGLQTQAGFAGLPVAVRDALTNLPLKR